MYFLNKLHFPFHIIFIIRFEYIVHIKTFIILQFVRFYHQSNVPKSRIAKQHFPVPPVVLILIDEVIKFVFIQCDAPSGGR